MPRTYHVRRDPRMTFCGRQISGLDPAAVRVGPGTATCKRCLAGWDANVARRRGLLDAKRAATPPVREARCPVCGEVRRLDANGCIVRHVNYLLDHCLGSYQRAGNS